MTVVSTPEARIRFLAACSICPEIMRLHNGHRSVSDIEQDLWAELVACILGSRVRDETVKAGLDKLSCMGVIELGYLMQRGPAASFDIAAALRKLPRQNGGLASHPFPRLRADQIVASFAALYRAGPGLVALLRRHRDASCVRRELVATAAGIGAKQASLFLRNIGRSDDLAILDVHVLRYMELQGLREGKGPPRSLAPYETLEESLREHARNAGYTLGCFDYAVWVVMRTLKTFAWKAACAL